MIKSNYQNKKQIQYYQIIQYFFILHNRILFNINKLEIIVLLYMILKLSMNFLIFHN